MIYKGLSIEKGETIPTAEVLNAHSNLRSSRADWQIVLGFKEGLEKTLRDAGYAANVRATEAGVSWLSDGDALTFNKRRRVCGRRKLRRALAGLDNVETSNLSADEKKDCEKQQSLLVRENDALRAIRSASEFAVPMKRDR